MFLYTLHVRHWPLSVLHHLFKDVCITFNNGRWASISLYSKGQVWFLPIIKNLGSVSLCFLSCNTICCRHHLNLFPLPCGLTPQTANTLATSISIHNKLFCVCYSGVSCPLPASVKACQANLLVFKWVKISVSDLSVFDRWLVGSFWAFNYTVFHSLSFSFVWLCDGILASGL